MGQKVNPIAVRLNLNRLSDYNWFSDYYYSALFFQDINLQQYLNLVKQPNSNKLGFRVGKCIIHRFPKRSFIHLFCLSDQRIDSFSTASSVSSNTLRLFLANQENEKNSLRPLLSDNMTVITPSDIDFFNKNNYLRSSIFWLNSPIQQKKRALINLFRGLSFQSAQRFLKTEEVGQKNFMESLKMLPGLKRIIKTEEITVSGEKHSLSFKQLNIDKSFAEHQSKDCILHENSIKRISENKKYWNKRYSFQPSLTDSQIVSNSGTFKNKLKNTAANSKNLYFHFYIMYYYFMQKMNISNVNVSKAQRTIKFLRFWPNQITENKAAYFTSELQRLNSELYANFSVSQMTQNMKPQKQVIPFELNKITSHKKEAGFQQQRSRSVAGHPSVWPSSRALSNIRNVLSLTTNTSISFQSLKVHSIFHSANLVAQEIACKLEQKKSFRLICRLIFQQLILHPSIKGIRITCSGRINGAEIAKTECRKFGETSLHVFSDKIDYAQAIASTSYGILGVKVWISFI